MKAAEKTNEGLGAEREGAKKIIEGSRPQRKHNKDARKTRRTKE